MCPSEVILKADHLKQQCSSILLVGSGGMQQVSPSSATLQQANACKMGRCHLSYALGKQLCKAKEGSVCLSGSGALDPVHSMACKELQSEVTADLGQADNRVGGINLEMRQELLDCTVA